MGDQPTQRLSYSGVPRHADRHQMEFCIVAAVRMYRLLTGKQFAPTRVSKRGRRRSERTKARCWHQYRPVRVSVENVAPARQREPRACGPRLGLGLARLARAKLRQQGGADEDDRPNGGGHADPEMKDGEPQGSSALPLHRDPLDAYNPPRQPEDRCELAFDWLGGRGHNGASDAGSGPHVDPHGIKGGVPLYFPVGIICMLYERGSTIAPPTPLCVQGSGFRTYAILLMTVFMSSAEKARSVSVRMLPCPPMLNASAVAAISSAASLIVTMS